MRYPITSIKILSMYATRLTAMVTVWAYLASCIAMPAHAGPQNLAPQSGFKHVSDPQAAAWQIEVLGELYRSTTNAILQDTYARSARGAFRQAAHSYERGDGVYGRSHVAQLRRLESVSTDRQLSNKNSDAEGDGIRSLPPWFPDGASLEDRIETLIDRITRWQSMRAYASSISLHTSTVRTWVRARPEIMDRVRQALGEYPSLPNWVPGIRGTDHPADRMNWLLDAILRWGNIARFAMNGTSVNASAVDRFFMRNPDLRKRLTRTLGQYPSLPGWFPGRAGRDHPRDRIDQFVDAIVRWQSVTAYARSIDTSPSTVESFLERAPYLKARVRRGLSEYPNLPEWVPGEVGVHHPRERIDMLIDEMALWGEINSFAVAKGRHASTIHNFLTNRNLRERARKVLDEHPRLPDWVPGIRGVDHPRDRIDQLVEAIAVLQSVAGFERSRGLGEGATTSFLQYNPSIRARVHKDLSRYPSLPDWVPGTRGVDHPRDRVRRLVDAIVRWGSIQLFERSLAITPSLAYRFIGNHDSLYSRVRAALAEYPVPPDWVPGTRGTDHPRSRLQLLVNTLWEQGGDLSAVSRILDQSEDEVGHFLNRHPIYASRVQDMLVSRTAREAFVIEALPEFARLQGGIYEDRARAAIFFVHEAGRLVDRLQAEWTPWLERSAALPESNGRGSGVHRLLTHPDMITGLLDDVEVVPVESWSAEDVTIDWLEYLYYWDSASRHVIGRSSWNGELSARIRNTWNHWIASQLARIPVNGNSGSATYLSWGDVHLQGEAFESAQTNIDEWYGLDVEVLQEHSSAVVRRATAIFVSQLHEELAEQMLILSDPRRFRYAVNGLVLAGAGYRWADGSFEQVEALAGDGIQEQAADVRLPSWFPEGDSSQARIEAFIDQVVRWQGAETYARARGISVNSVSAWLGRHTNVRLQVRTALAEYPHLPDWVPGTRGVDHPRDRIEQLVDAIVRYGNPSAFATAVEVHHTTVHNFLTASNLRDRVLEAIAEYPSGLPDWVPGTLGVDHPRDRITWLVDAIARWQAIRAFENHVHVGANSVRDFLERNPSILARVQNTFAEYPRLPDWVPGTRGVDHPRDRIEQLVDAIVRWQGVAQFNRSLDGVGEGTVAGFLANHEPIMLRVKSALSEYAPPLPDWVPGHAGVDYPKDRMRRLVDTIVRWGNVERFSAAVGMSSPTVHHFLGTRGLRPRVHDALEKHPFLPDWVPGTAGVDHPRDRVTQLVDAVVSWRSAQRFARETGMKGSTAQAFLRARGLRARIDAGLAEYPPLPEWIPGVFGQQHPRDRIQLLTDLIWEHNGNEEEVARMLDAPNGAVRHFLEKTRYAPLVQDLLSLRAVGEVFETGRHSGFARTQQGMYLRRSQAGMFFVREALALVDDLQREWPFWEEGVRALPLQGRNISADHLIIVHPSMVNRLLNSFSEKPLESWTGEEPEIAWLEHLYYLSRSTQGVLKKSPVDGKLKSQIWDVWYRWVALQLSRVRISGRRGHVETYVSAADIHLQGKDFKPIREDINDWHELDEEILREVSGERRREGFDIPASHLLKDLEDQLLILNDPRRFRYVVNGLVLRGEGYRWADGSYELLVPMVGDGLHLSVRDHYTAMSRAAADTFKETVNAAIREKDKAVVIVPVGSSPRGMYDRLVEMAHQGEIDFGKVILFLIDEKEGSDAFRGELFRDFVAQLPAHHTARPTVYTIDGEGDFERAKAVFWQDFRRETANTESADLTVLGIGHDGHFGMVFPGYVDGEFLIRSQIPGTDNEWGRTMGLWPVWASQKILVLAGDEKRDILRRIWDADASSASEIPAVALKEHADVTFLVTAEAASGIEGDGVERATSIPSTREEVLAALPDAVERFLTTRPEPQAPDVTPQIVDLLASLDRPDLFGSAEGLAGTADAIAEVFGESGFGKLSRTKRGKRVAEVLGLEGRKGAGKEMNRIAQLYESLPSVVPTRPMDIIALFDPHFYKDSYQRLLPTLKRVVEIAAVQSRPVVFLGEGNWVPQEDIKDYVTHPTEAQMWRRAFANGSKRVRREFDEVSKQIRNMVNQRVLTDPTIPGTDPVLQYRRAFEVFLMDFPNVYFVIENTTFESWLAAVRADIDNIDARRAYLSGDDTAYREGLERYTGSFAESLKSRDQQVLGQFEEFAEKQEDPIVVMVRGFNHHWMLRELDTSRYRALSALTHTAMDPYTDDPAGWVADRLISDPSRPLSEREISYLRFQGPFEQKLLEHKGDRAIRTIEAFDGRMRESTRAMMGETLLDALTIETPLVMPYIRTYESGISTGGDGVTAADSRGSNWFGALKEKLSRNAFLWIGGTFVLTDQLTKWFIRFKLPLLRLEGGEIINPDAVLDVFEIREHLSLLIAHTENILPFKYGILFIALSALIVKYALSMRKNELFGDHKLRFLYHLFYGSILGASVGNSLDVLLRGRVTDWIILGINANISSPSFNISDIAAVTALFLTPILWVGRNYQKGRHLGQPPPSVGDGLQDYTHIMRAEESSQGGVSRGDGIQAVSEDALPAWPQQPERGLETPVLAGYPAAGLGRIPESSGDGLSQASWTPDPAPRSSYLTGSGRFKRRLNLTGDMERWIIERSGMPENPLDIAVHGQQAVEAFLPALERLAHTDSDLALGKAHSGLRLVFILTREEKAALETVLPAAIPVLLEDTLPEMSIHALEEALEEIYQAGVVIDHWLGSKDTWTRYADSLSSDIRLTLQISFLTSQIGDLRDHADWDDLAPQLFLAITSTASAA